MNFEVKEENDRIIGTLDGRLDTAAAINFTKDIEALVEKADKHILLDCTKLEYISSSGLRAFLTLRKSAGAKGGDVTIKGINEEIQKVFKMTGFYNLFKIVD